MLTNSRLSKVFHAPAPGRWLERPLHTTCPYALLFDLGTAAWSIEYKARQRANSSLRPVSTETIGRPAPSGLRKSPRPMLRTAFATPGFRAKPSQLFDKNAFSAP